MSDLRRARDAPLAADVPAARGLPRRAGAAICAAIEDVLLRVSALVEAHPEIAELDLNPVVASPDGALILDARVRIEAAPPTPPMPSLEA